MSFSPRVLAILAALASASPAAAQTVEAGAPVEAVAEVGGPERALGRADAPVRIDLYASFVCVECAAWWGAVLPELKGRYIDPGQVRLVFHDVAIEPIQHSVRASMIGLCADPARFFDVADAFMGGLAGAREDTATVPAWYERAVGASGKTADEMATCTSQEAVYEQVRAQNSRAAAASLPALPAVLVNGRPLQDPSAEAIAAAILFAPAEGE